MFNIIENVCAPKWTKKILSIFWNIYWEVEGAPICKTIAYKLVKQLQMAKTEQ